MARRIGETSVVELSPREAQLLHFAQNGLTDQAIANELGISLATIATYWGRVRIKFGPLSRTEIVAKHVQAKTAESLEVLQNEVDSLKQQLFEGNRESSLVMLGCYHHKEAVLILNEEHRVLFANQVALSVLERSRDEVIGRQMVEFWPEDRRDEWYWAYEQLRVNPYIEALTTDVPTVVKTPAGVVRSLTTNLTPYETPEGLRIFTVSRLEL